MSLLLALPMNFVGVSRAADPLVTTIHTGPTTIVTVAAVPVAEPVNVLVLPFQMFGNDTSYAWISRALEQNLAIEVVRNPALHWVPRTDAPATIDVDEAAKAANQVHAAIVVFGSYQISNVDVRITAYVMDVASGRVFGAVKTSGPTRAIFALEDQLDDQLMAAIGQQVPNAAAAYARSKAAAAAQQAAAAQAAQAANAAANAQASPNPLPPVEYYSPDANTNYPYYSEYPAVPPYTSSIYTPDMYYPQTNYPYGPVYYYPGYPVFGFGGDFRHHHFDRGSGDHHDIGHDVGQGSVGGPVQHFYAPQPNPSMNTLPQNNFGSSAPRVTTPMPSPAFGHSFGGGFGQPGRSR